MSDIWGIMAGILAVIFSVAAVVFQETLRAWQKFLALTVAGILAASSKLIFGYVFAAFLGKASASRFFSCDFDFFGMDDRPVFMEKNEKDR